MAHKHTPSKKQNIAKILKEFQNRHINCLTSYTANTASAIDGIVDIVLVGDSLGVVLYGMQNTLPVTLETMIAHGQAVSSAVKESIVVIDMPFGYYEASPEEAFRNATKLLKEVKCDAIKIEGGANFSETVSFLASRGIPVMGHVGLMPQRHKIQGTLSVEHNSQKVLQDLRAISSAGAFAVVVENVNTKTAQQISTQFPNILTIGVGVQTPPPAKAQDDTPCSALRHFKGTIAVLEDLCGLSTHQPPFSKPIKNLLAEIQDAAQQYTQLNSQK